MKPLQTTQQVLTWLCVLPADETVSERKKLLYRGSVFVISVSMVCEMLASVAFFFKFMNTDIEASLYAAAQIVAMFAMGNIIVATYFLRPKIIAIFENLSKIQNEHEYDYACQFYLREASNKSEKIWRFYFKFMFRGFIYSTLICSTASVVIGWIIEGHFQSKYLYRPANFVLPWNQETLIGYIGEICFVIIGAEAFLICNGTLILLFISICWYHQAFYKIFRHSLSKMDYRKYERTKEIICEVICFQVDIKDWFSQTAKLYTPYIMVQLISNVVMLAAIIFHLHLIFEKGQADFNIVIILIVILDSLFNIFLFCYFGKLASESFEKMTDLLYEINWNDLPQDLQKYFLMMIKNSQRPIYYHGYGIATLNLETFCSLLRIVYSYYTMFLTLTNR